MANDKDSCCGGAHRVMYKKDEATGKIVRMEVSEEGKVPIEVEFVGSRAGNFTVYGAVTKRAYRFGNFQRVQDVYEEDVESVLQNPAGFRLVGGPAISRPTVRRGTAPNTDGPIVPQRPQTTPTISAAEAAARVASAVQARQQLPKEGVADNSVKRGPGRPRKEEPTIQQPVQRMKPYRNTRGTTRVDPRILGG